MLYTVWKGRSLLVAHKMAVLRVFLEEVLCSVNAWCHTNLAS